MTVSFFFFFFFFFFDRHLFMHEQEFGKENLHEKPFFLRERHKIKQLSSIHFIFNLRVTWVAGKL